MTEVEWLGSEDWRPMLLFLSGRWTQRKAILYLCAGLRRIWNQLYHHASQEAVELAERNEDKAVSPDDISYARWGAECPTFGYDFEPKMIRKWHEQDGEYCESVQRLMEMGVYTATDLKDDEQLGDEAVRTSLKHAAYLAESCLYSIHHGELGEDRLRNLSWIKNWPEGWLVREIVGNPFRVATVNSAWLAWNGGTVRRIAQAIYDDRAFDHMPILADALEDADCDNADILNHCREAGVHVRGCWVVDLLLGMG